MFIDVNNVLFLFLPIVSNTDVKYLPMPSIIGHMTAIFLSLQFFHLPRALNLQIWSIFKIIHVKKKETVRK